MTNLGYTQENAPQIALKPREVSDADLAAVDLDRFWADQAVAIADPFGEHIPQCPLGIFMGDWCVFDELGVEEDLWRQETDDAWRVALNKAYNDRAEWIVGRRLLPETYTPPELRYPERGALYTIFEGRNEWHSGAWWLTQAANNEAELSALLDRVERRLEGDLREVLLPENWEREKARLLAEGIQPPLYRHQRGPCTFAASIYGAENLIFLILDNPDLAGRFSRLILRSMLEMARIYDEEAGYTPETAPHGWSFADDNCVLLNPDMYKFFGYPVLKGMFDRYSPNPEDKRYQHSDSAMGHLVPIIGQLDMTGVNFGPTVMADHIRKWMPHAAIYGVLAPFTFMRNDKFEILRQFRRDFELTRETKGLVFATAGSINGGSALTSLRLIMSAIQHEGRY